MEPINQNTTVQPAPVQSAQPTQQVVPPVEPEIIEITPTEDVINLDPQAPTQTTPTQQMPAQPTQPVAPAPAPAPAQPIQQMPSQTMPPRPAGVPLDMVDRLARLEAEAIAGRQAQQELEKLRQSGRQDPALKAELERRIGAAKEYLGDGFDPVAGMINGIVSVQNQEIMNAIDEKVKNLSQKMQTFEKMQRNQQKIEVANAWVKDFINKGIPEETAYAFVDNIIRDPRTQDYDATTLGSIIGAEAYKYMSAQHNAGQQPPTPQQAVPMQPTQPVPTQPAQVTQPAMPQPAAPQIAAQQQAKLQGQIAVGAGGQPAPTNSVPPQLDSLILQQSLRQNMW